MTLEQAQVLASALALLFRRKAFIDPTFRSSGESLIAVITNATELEVGFCVGRCNLFLPEDLPKRSRSTPHGRAFFQATPSNKGPML